MRVYTLGLLMLVTLVTSVRSAPPPINPLGVNPTAKQIALGRKLFFDPLLSEDLTISCATCHNPKLGFSDGKAVAVGIRGQRGTRNSPTILNSAYFPLVFWDGRTIESSTQALLPLSNPIEMGRQSENDVLNKLRADPSYNFLFADAFRQANPINGPNLAIAIAAYETTIISWDALIDKPEDLSSAAKVGRNLFTDSYCTKCHVPPHYTDRMFHNNGFEFAGKFPGTALDRGRASVVRNVPGTIRAFKTPTLREVQRTSPYGHHGLFDDLERVVIHYTSGGKRYDGKTDPEMDRRIVPTGWDKQQQKYVVIFLKEAFRGRVYPDVE